MLILAESIKETWYRVEFEYSLPFTKGRSNGKGEQSVGRFIKSLHVRLQRLEGSSFASSGVYI